MAIVGAGQGAVQERKLYTGLCDMNVIAVNPNKEELMEILGTENIKDSMVNYDNSKDGVDSLRIDFWLKSEKLSGPVKASFFIDNTCEPSKAGNIQWINDIGQSGWGETPEVVYERAKEWGLYRNTGTRKARGGEAALYEFLVAWSQIDQRTEDSKLVLDTDWEVLVSGDVSELEKIIPMLKKADPKTGKEELLKVRVLLTVRNEQYQGVYGRHFLKEGSNYIKGLQKQLDGETKAVDYGGSFILKEYVPGQVPVQTAMEASASEMDELMAGLD